MTDKELYTYSKNFDLFVRKIKALMNFQYYRYSKLVDNSPIGEGGYPDGLECVYARHTKRLGKEEQHHLLRYLKLLLSDIQGLIEVIENSEQENE